MAGETGILAGSCVPRVSELTFAWRGSRAGNHCDGGATNGSSIPHDPARRKQAFCIAARARDVGKNGV